MSEFPLLSAPDPLAAAVARAERAEAVVRLLVETEGKCGARFDGAVTLACSLSTDQHDVHHVSGWFWTDTNPGASASPWTPDLIAARDEILAGSQGEAK